MEIIDFRFRPNTPEVINGIKNSNMFKAACKAVGFDARKAEPLETIVENLKKSQISIAVVTGRDCETTYGSPANNSAILSYCKAYPKLFKGFWGVDPHKGMKAVAEIEKAIKEYNMLGVATDPYLAHISPSHRKFYPIYAKCAELNVPVFITTAPPPEVPNALIQYTSPLDVEIAAHDFPELTFIMSHGGYPYVQEAIFVCQRNSNVYMDISEYEKAPMADIYLQAIKTTISDKVVFASAHPFIELKDALETYNKFDFSPELREKIMSKNARKLLKI